MLSNFTYIFDAIFDRLWNDLGRVWGPFWLTLRGPGWVLEGFSCSLFGRVVPKASQNMFLEYLGFISGGFGFHFGSWDLFLENSGFNTSPSPSWRGFWDDFGAQVGAKLGHVGHQVGLKWLYNITPKIMLSKSHARIPGNPR